MVEYNFDCEIRDENTSFKHHVIGNYILYIFGSFIVRIN